MGVVNIEIKLQAKNLQFFVQRIVSQIGGIQYSNQITRKKFAYFCANKCISEWK